MKVQELLEDQQQRIDFNSYDEFVQWFESQDAMHVADMEGTDGNAYDVLIVQEQSHVQQPDQGADNPDDFHGYADVEWEMIAHGASDENGENWFAVQGEIELTDQSNARIEELLLDPN